MLSFMMAITSWESGDSTGARRPSLPKQLVRISWDQYWMSFGLGNQGNFRALDVGAVWCSYIFAVVTKRRDHLVDQTWDKDSQCLASAGNMVNPANPVKEIAMLMGRPPNQCIHNDTGPIHPWLGFASHELHTCNWAEAGSASGSAWRRTPMLQSCSW